MQTAAATNYYSKSTGALNLTSSWGTNTDGSGFAPLSFSALLNSNVFYIQNNPNPTITGNWTVDAVFGLGSAKIVVGDGVNACNFTIPSGFTFSGTVDVSNAGTLTITNTTLPTFGTLNTGSTVVFNAATAQSFPGLTYYNLTVANGTTNPVAGDLAITNTLTVSSGTTLNLGTNIISALGINAGTGTISTQNTTNTAIPSGKTWTGTVAFNNAATLQNIPAGSYNNLSVLAPATNVAKGAVSVSGTFNIGAGATLNMGTNLLTAVGTPAGTGTLSTQNTSTAPIPSGKTWTGPVAFNNATTLQNVPAGTYANLSISAPAINVAQGDISQSGTFNIGTGATLSMGTNRLAALGTQSGAGALTTQNTASTTPIPSGVTWTWPVTYNATSGNQTVVTGTYGNLSLLGSATKTFAAGTVNVSGAWNSAGGAVDLATNALTLNFTGASAQVITDAGSGSGAGLTFKTVNFSGAGTKTLVTGPFYLHSAGVLTLIGTTTLATGGVLTLNSDALSSATIAAVPSGASITGNVNVRRYFSGGAVATQRAYRLMGFPVNTNGVIDNSGSTANYDFSGVKNYLYTGGPNGAAGGFTVTNQGSSTVMLYREDIPPVANSFNNGNYRGMATLGGSAFPIINHTGTYSLWAGGGAMIFYVGSKNGGTFNTKVGTVYPDPDNAVMVSTGTLNQGQQPVKLWYNASTSFSYTSPAMLGDQGFALVGNPYPSTIDWDTFSSSVATSGIYGQGGITNTVYVYNYKSKNYGTYQAGTSGGLGTNNSGRYIGSGQGFFVKTTTAGAKLTFNEAAKTNTQPNSLGTTNFLMGMPVTSAVPQLLRVKNAQDAVNTDDIIILFEADKSNGYDPEFDADDLNGIGNLIGLSSYASNSGRKLAINHMGSISPFTRVKLFVTGTTAVTDTLSITGTESLDKRYNLYLIDHYKNDSVLVTPATRYAYSIKPADTTTMGSTRFELVFHTNQTYAHYKLLNFSAKKVIAGVQLTWTVENEQNFTGFTIQRADGSQKLITFQSIYSLQSNGKGTYTYLDITPLKGTTKYRLMQNDAFEKVTYSDIVNVDASAIANQPELPLVKLYPNPTVDNIQIILNTDFKGNLVHLAILNSNGLVMLDKNIGVSNLVQNVSNLMPGTYVVEISDPETRKVIGNKKFIKL